MTPLQCRMARVLCRMTVQELADRAGISWSSIEHYELAYRSPESCGFASDLTRVFERLGVRFIDDCGVAYPPSWNQDIDAAMKPRQVERLEKDRLRARGRLKVSKRRPSAPGNYT